MRAKIPASLHYPEGPIECQDTLPIWHRDVAYNSDLFVLVYIVGGYRCFLFQVVSLFCLVVLMYYHFIASNQAIPLIVQIHYAPRINDPNVFMCIP